MRKENYVKPRTGEVRVDVESVMQMTSWTNDKELNNGGYGIIDGDPNDNSEWDPDDPTTWE